MSSKVKAIPEGYEGATPYLIIKDAARALEFYKKAFGAAEIMRIPSPGGKVGHAEIKIGAATLMLADDFPRHELQKSPVVRRYACEHHGVCPRCGHVRQASRIGGRESAEAGGE